MQIVCETPDMQGGSWNEDGMMIFASSRGLFRVLAAGGDPVPLVAADPEQKGNEAGRISYPYFLPDGRHFVYQASSGQPSQSAIFAASLDSPKERKQLISATSNAAYAEPGYLLYHRDGTLFAAPFDARKLAVTGDAIRVGDRVPYTAAGAAAWTARSLSTFCRP